MDIKQSNFELSSIERISTSTKIGKKGVIAKAFIVLATVILLCTSTLAADIQLSKTSNKEEYNIGEMATYNLEVCNPSQLYSCTFDIYDEYPDGNSFLQYNGTLIQSGLTLSPGNCWSGPVTYVVEEKDVAPDKNIWNWLYVVGDNSIGENVRAAVSDVAAIIPTPTPTPTPEDCCESCGTKVEHDQNDTEYVLRPVDARIAYHDSNSDGDFDSDEVVYLDMLKDDVGPWVIESGDIRLTNFDYIPPNTKVTSNSEDHGYTLRELPGGQAVIGYVDIHLNGIYDIEDPLYIDTDDNSFVSVNDIRLTPRIVLNTSYGSYSRVQIGDLDIAGPNALHDLITNGDIETPLSTLIGFVDSDCSGDWTCPDKLYLQQIVGGLADEFVTIGDFRLYVPQNALDMGWPACGSKVKQGDKDATYVLTKESMRIMFGDLNNDGICSENETIYLDTEIGDDVVEAGDIRLTEYGNGFYPPNTKVFSKEIDKNDPLAEFKGGQAVVGFVDSNNNKVYDLADSLYVDVDDSSSVSLYDLRLTERTISNITYYPYTRVANGNLDLLLNNDLLNPIPPYDTNLTAEISDLLGFIDSDCNGKWSCPDKLYLQQMTFEGITDEVVSVGDFRIYMPDELGWPECGTKVKPCDVDNTNVLRKDSIEIGFGDLNSNGLFNPEDGEAIYIDMVVDRDVVEAGDVRLSMFGDQYEPNTKVDPADVDMLVEFVELPGGQSVVGYVDMNNDKTYDITDPIYVDTDDSSTVTVYDLRLTERFALGILYKAYTIVQLDDKDLIGDKELHDIVTDDTELTTELQNIVGYFDADCSNSWTCPDRLYLQQMYVESPADWTVTIGDFRLYSPCGPSDPESEPEPEPPEPGCTDPCCIYDTNGTLGIQLDEAVAAVRDYFDSEIDLETAIIVISCYFVV